MWRFLKKAFTVMTTFFSPPYVNSLECISMNNQECKARPKIIDVNNNEPVFYPYSIKVNKCSGNCSNINDPYVKLYAPDTVKNINVKVFNLMSRINETRQIIWHETCKCVCRLTSALCNSRQIWNKDKCRCECKEELINKMVCDKGYIWNPSNCACECDKLCDIGQYLNYKNCVCRKSLVDKLVEECISVIDGDTIYNETLTVASSSDCAWSTPYIVLFIVFLSISVAISAAFVYFHWYKNKQLKLKDTLMLTIQRLKQRFIRRC